jgi:hypothetical protein
VPVGGRYGIADVPLDADAVSAVMVLAVYDVAGDAIAFAGCGIFTVAGNKHRRLGYQRHVVAARIVPGRHRRRHIVGAGIARVDAVVLEQHRLVVSAGTRRRGDGRTLILTDFSAALLAAHDKRRVSVHTRPKRSGNIVADIHNAAALVVETQDARHHIRAAFTCLERGCAFLLVADASRCRGGSGTKACCEQQAARIPAASAVRSGQRRRYALLCKNPFLLRIPWRQAVWITWFRRRYIPDVGNKGLLLHPRLGLYRRGYIMQIPHLVPLVAGEGHGRCSRSGLVFFFCRYIAMSAAFSAIKGRPYAVAVINTAALHVPGRQAFSGVSSIEGGSPACIRRARRSTGGSSLPRFFALRRMPKQAVLLK